MERYLLPGAVLVVGLLALVMFRHEVLPSGDGSVRVLVRDRWLGSVKYCAAARGQGQCVVALSQGYEVE